MNLSLPCDIWPGSKDRDGYGRITLGPHRGSWRDDHEYRVARLIYTEWYGVVLEPGMEPDHLCRNTSCWEPAHLEAVTTRVNTLRGNNRAAINARKTHCLNGHPLSEAYITTKGQRHCRVCNRERVRIWRVRKAQRP